MKEFFKDMWYGVKGLYKEHRRFILMNVFYISGMVIPMRIAQIFTDSKKIVLILGIVGLIIGLVLFFNYIHFQEAKEYSKDHGVSFKTAWNKTKIFWR